MFESYSIFCGLVFLVLINHGVPGSAPRLAGPWPHSTQEVILQLCNRQFFRCPFESNLARSWLDFPSQLASQSPPKSIKNRCQDAFPCWLQFLIDFSSISTSNFDPQNLQNHCYSFGEKKMFSKNRSSKLGSIFDAILVDTWRKDGSDLAPKSI